MGIINTPLGDSVSQADAIKLAEAEAAVIKAKADAIMADAMAIFAEAEATKAEAEVAKIEAEIAKANAVAAKAEAEAAIAEAELLKFERAQQNYAKSNRENIKNSTNVQPVTQIKGAVSVASLEKGDKLPKERFVLLPEEYLKFGVTNFKATAIKDSAYTGEAKFMINGEYDAKTKECVVVIFMVFNANNELIGASFDEEIEEEKKRHKTYSTTVAVPTNESISRIEVRMIQNPTRLDWY